MKTALIAGSTGLIGQQLLRLLIESPLYEKVIAITRHDLVAHPEACSDQNGVWKHHGEVRSVKSG